MSTITELGSLPLAGTKKGVISVSNVTEPYGKDTADIVSIGAYAKNLNLSRTSFMILSNLAINVWGGK